MWFHLVPAGKKYGGRVKGTPNKATVDIKALAQSYGADAINSIVEIAMNPKAGNAIRLAAWRELLDRGYGRAPQIISGDATALIIHEIRHLIVDPPQTLESKSSELRIVDSRD